MDGVFETRQRTNSLMDLLVPHGGVESRVLLVVVRDLLPSKTVNRFIADDRHLEAVSVEVLENDMMTGDGDGDDDGET